MEAYSGFAGVYDIFMDDTPYDEWCGYLAGLMERYGISAPRPQEADRNGTASSRPQEADRDGTVSSRPQEADRDGTVSSRRPDAADAEREKEAALQSERNLVLELGCGTGNLTERMAALGYDMIGVDSSQEMLSVAMEKRTCKAAPLYLQQDMRELELYSTVGTVLCVCDSINYLLSEADVAEVFRRVNTYLFPGGIFIFDFNTVYKYEQVIGDTTIAENREDCSFIWENYYDPEAEINEYDLTIFMREAEHAGEPRHAGKPGHAGKPEVFRRFQETHYQRGYTAGQMIRLVQQAGMRVELVADADTHGDVREESERIYILAREIAKGESK